jgi:cell wall-associated NlpC family hydrolase
MRWVRRATTAATLAIGLIIIAIRPAQAAPPAPVPEGGPAPNAQGDLSFPVVPQPITAAPATEVHPLVAQVRAARAKSEGVSQQILTIDAELATIHTTTDKLRKSLETATAKVTDLKEKAAQIATDAYKQALEMGPFEGYANDLQNLGLIVPALPSQHEEAKRPSQRDSIGYEVVDAERAERAARTAYDASTAAEQEISARRAILNEQFVRYQAAVTTLETRHADVLPALEAAADVYEASQGVLRGVSSSINGLQGSAKALAAVAFALSQRGKPYEWGAEGPNSYDCSGLMLASYLSVGVHLPRVSRDQYNVGTPVLVSQLIPGDLLFFSTDRFDARQIHHVAMYIGNGQMVHAPTFGQVVKISPIWWSEYFGATRVVAATAIPGTPPPTTPPPTPTPTPTPSPTPSPTPTVPPTTTPPTTAPPTTTPPTTTPPTTAPPTTTPPTTTPPTTAPPTTTPPTATPETTAPTTTPTAALTSPAVAPSGGDAALPAVVPRAAAATAGRSRWRRSRGRS